MESMVEALCKLYGGDQSDALHLENYLIDFPKMRKPRGG
jgi:hypothetical protein